MPGSAAQPPPAGGHYAPAVRAGGFVFISGQLAIGEDGAPAADAGVEAQTQMCLENMRRILKSEGLDLRHVVKTTVYVSDVDLWPAVNAAYAEFFGDHRPARAVVPVKKLYFGLDVEIEAIAAANSHREE